MPQNFMELMQQVNTDTSGWFGVLLILAITILVFMGLKWGTTPAKAGLTASFIALVCTIILSPWGVNIVNFYLIIPIVAMIAGLGWASYSEGSI